MKKEYIVYDHPLEEPNYFVVYREVDGVRDMGFSMVSKDLGILQNVLLVDMRLKLVERWDSAGKPEKKIIEKYTSS